MSGSRRRHGPLGGPEERTVPRLHLVTDDRVLAGEGWLESATACLAVGGDAVALHVRGPRAAGHLLYRLTSALADVVRRSGGWLLVNDRVDVALAAGVTGAHLGARSLPTPEARRVLGSVAVLGRSVHTAAELDSGASRGLDFAAVGAIFPTPSHEGLSGIGVDGLREAVVAAGSLPVIAIGGVEPERLSDLRETGAHGVAAIRAIWDEPDPARAVERFLVELEGWGE